MTISIQELRKQQEEQEQREQQPTARFPWQTEKEPPLKQGILKFVQYLYSE